ncbi:hypothetical protein SAMD00023353_0301070 [Rosellinia necatrix]|uniref:Uncharacterized protein n=1 Tax=Rosellinia necatrix TaxID=77044 RepID=A0A1W2TDD0_ROSNE|nr:hypothetical protein SAMD00023353_0301070 [Rosellinia necatrix]
MPLVYSVRGFDYDGIPSPPAEEGADFDIQDSQNWPQQATWPCTVVERFCNALEDNSFSNMNTEDLPPSTNAIATAASASPAAMSVEAIGFAIMARNVGLVYDLVDEAMQEDLDLSAIYPYHLAASHLDGSSTRCEMFCHTSVQAVCHTIARLFSALYSPDIDTPSGLFTKSCFTCGDQLVPGPLHALVLIAFNLAQKGREGETLFGMVACLTCMLIHGADPTAKANLSVDLLLGVDEQHECTHERLDPLGLGEKVPQAALDAWAGETRLGWGCFMAGSYRLQKIDRARMTRTTQTEFLSYRRIRDGDA